MISLRRLLLVLLLGAAPLSFAAGQATPQGTDPVLERRVVKLTEELRCLVCQNQNIADSHADLAIDLKNQVREKFLAGMSEEDIKDYMVQRYGDFVLYRPPVRTSTWLLWFGPFLLLSVGLVVLFLKLRKRARKVDSAVQLSEADHERAQALLGQQGNREGV
jgi:cytochrome c-type biogenesis protein CcmH